MNLTEGIPVSDIREMASLVTSKGFMLGKMGFRKELAAGHVKLDEASYSAYVDILATYYNVYIHVSCKLRVE